MNDHDFIIHQQRDFMPFPIRLSPDALATSFGLHLVGGTEAITPYRAINASSMRIACGFHVA